MAGVEPVASRPYMPDYGILGPSEGSGLLPWAWAIERLESSHDYWIATVWPDGRPHVTPVWGLWHGDAVWFSAGSSSRKMRNIAADPRVTVTTDKPLEPVILDGLAERVTEKDAVVEFANLVDAKYVTDYGPDFFLANACVRVTPTSAIGLDSADFTGSPTRWRMAR